MLSKATVRGLGQQVKVRLAADRCLCASNTASEIEGNLAVGEFVEAWGQLKGWYWLAEDQALKACPETLASQMAEREALYMAVPPVGWLLPINITPIPVSDKPAMDPEIREVMAKLWTRSPPWRRQLVKRRRWCGDIDDGGGDCGGTTAFVVVQQQLAGRGSVALAVVSVMSRRQQQCWQWVWRAAIVT
jgi:hypothetical protein